MLTRTSMADDTLVSRDKISDIPSGCVTRPCTQILSHPRPKSAKFSYALVDLRQVFLHDAKGTRRRRGFPPLIHVPD